MLIFPRRSARLAAARLHRLFEAPLSEGPTDALVLGALRTHTGDAVVSIFAADLRDLITLMSRRVAAQTSLRLDAQDEAKRYLERAQTAEEDSGDLCIRFDWETGRVTATDPAGRLHLDGISDVLAIVGRVLQGIKADHDRRNRRPYCGSCDRMGQACDSHS